MPSLIMLEVDGAPHQDGSPGTTACHQMIFHPKSCCFHCWSYWGRSRSEQGKPAQPSPVARPSAGRAAQPRPGRGSGFPPCGSGIQRPGPKSLPRHGVRAPLPSAAEPGQQESLLLVSGSRARLKSHPSDNSCFTLLLPPKIIAH